MKRYIIALAGIVFAALLSSCSSVRYECPACGRKTETLYECPVCYIEVCEYCADPDHFIECIYEDKDAIMDYVVGMGWVEEWIDEHEGKEIFRDGFLLGYDEGYEAGLKDGKED